MKINYKKIGLFIILLTFFTPDGMTTIRNQEYIQNAAFLNNEIVVECVYYMYWIRNLVGIFFCVLQGMKLIQRKAILRFSFSVASGFAIFALWTIIDACFNGVNIYQVVIHMAYCLGYLILAQTSMKDDKNFYFDNLLLISKLLIIINLLLIVCFPNGITTARDYLSTPYFLFGTKNQITPLLIMISMLLFMDYRRKKNLANLVLFQAIVILNTLLMGSGTSILCVAIMIIGNVVRVKNPRAINKNDVQKKNKKYKYIITGTALLSIGVVFFNLQNIFSWLIVGILKKDLSLSGRTTTWKLAIDQFLDKPVLGYGYGHIVTGHYSAHNIILELLVTTGIIGFLLYAMIVIKTFKRYFTEYENRFSIPVISAATALIIANIGESFIFNISQLTIFVLVGYNLNKKD